MREIKFETRAEMTDALRNENDCIQYLTHVRWNGTVQCCQCHSTRISWYERINKYRCKDCRYFFTATTNTAFHSCKNILRKYFIALADFINEEKNSYAVMKNIKTTQRVAWQMLTKTRTVLSREQQSFQLTGIVEIDESYLGGKATSDLRLAKAIWEWQREQDRLHGVSAYKRRKSGDLKKRGRKPGTTNLPNGKKRQQVSQRTMREAYKNQIAVLGMKQRGGPEIYIVLGKGKSAVSLDEVLPILQKYIAPDATVISDDASHYRKLKDYFPNHQIIKKKLRDKVTGKTKKYFDPKTGEVGRCFCKWEDVNGKRMMITVNGLEGKWGHLKAEYRGEYSHYSPEHMQGYLAEFAFRDKKGHKFGEFQNAFNELLRKMCSEKVTVDEIKKFTTVHDPKHDSKTKRRRVLRKIYNGLSVIVQKLIDVIDFLLIRK